MLAGTGVGGEPMVSEALLFSVPTVAVMVTVAFTAAFAVKVTAATPEALVNAVPAEKFPAVALLTVNVTLTPLIAAAAASLTVADTVMLPGGVGMDGDPSEITIEAGTWAGVPMVMGALPLIVVVPTATLTRMVAVVFTAAPAVNIDVA